MPDLLEVKNLHVSFTTPGGKVDGVRDMNFRVAGGSCVAVVGESGSGKSVSARAIMGILPANATIEKGEILFRDPALKGRESDLAKLAPASKAYRQVRGGRISIIFQEPMTSLSPLHTVGDQIGEALSLHEDLSAKQAASRTIEMLRLVRFPEPARAYRTYPFELSGGLRQRAMIAMALVCGPALLIADEPTTALDVTVQAQILGLIRDLQRELHMAVLIITHDMGVVANVAEEVVVVYKGEVMERGMVRDVIGSPRHPYLQALMRAVPTIDVDRPARLVPLRGLAPQEHRPEPTPRNIVHDEVLLTVGDLVKTFTVRQGALSLNSGKSRTIRAVDRVSFDIRRGECLALVGESGCGKTTVSKLIMGAIDPDSGTIGVNVSGRMEQISGLDDRAMIPYRKQVQYIFQDPFGSLNPRMTVYDILGEPLRVHQWGNDKQRRARIIEMMKKVGLDPRFLNRYPHSFSGGQRQRIGIARALMLEPQLVICDEPVSALDVSTQAQILNLLKDLQAELGLTFLFISHDLAVVNYVADRIAVMCRGKLVEIGPREKIFTHALHPYTRALLNSVPTTDLDHPLDFEAILAGLDTDPESWIEPFGARDGIEPGLLEVGGGHYVRAHDVPSAREAA